MATPWDVASAGWAVVVLGWLLSPIIGSLAPKILSYLGFDPENKLEDLELRIIPELQQNLQAVDQERMMRRGDEKRTKGDLAKLDKMAAMLRHAQEDAEDIFDDAGEKIKSRCWQRLHGAFAACISLCKISCVWVVRIVHTRSSRILQWARKISLPLFLQRRRSQEPIPANNSVAVGVIVDILAPVTASDEPDSATTSSEAANPAATNEIAVTMAAPPSVSFGRRLISCLCSSFDFFNNCLVHVKDAAARIKNCQDIFLTAISRGKLKKRIQKVENTIDEVKKSPLMDVASKSAPNDIAKKSPLNDAASKSAPNYIANRNRRSLGAVSKREVLGRKVLRDQIMEKLRATPPTPQVDAPSSSRPYSVIGIYGVAGSGKTTFAEYVRDYIKEECTGELFKTIMCIHVSETFSVDDIFHKMLKDITGDQHKNISDREKLAEKLKEALRNKRFFLILDDLWVRNKNDQQLEELISPLNVGSEGSKILVTARTIDAAGALCANEVIQMPDLDEDQYFKMFMHYAVGGGTSVEFNEFERVGRLIANKLHRSPIAAVTVAGRLGTNRNMSFWKNTANHEMFNETIDALWWSYQQLNPDIRRCFEFCNIFPRRFKLRKEQLVRLWMAQGFVKTSCATEEMEEVAEGYIQELVSCSFLHPEGNDCFTIHDLLHDLLDKVSGNDYYKIENGSSKTGEGWKGDVPQDVRHLFVQNYDAELITEKILGLENLRTLIIYVVERVPVEEKVIESICKRLRKLRVLAIAFNSESDRIISPNNKFLVPESIIQLKHLRYLAIQIVCTCTVILPSALAKLHHIQLLDFGHGRISEFTFIDLINLRHIFCWCENFPNVGRLRSLRTLPCFTVRNEQGYELKQLRDLNKLSGKLVIRGLESVFSKDKALEANLAAKEWLTELTLEWKVSEVKAEVEAEVLEGLCPPAGLQTLRIQNYRGSRYPGWMVGKQNGGPKDLKNLYFYDCKQQLGPGPELEAFTHLQILTVDGCDWDTLPGNMEHLTSLKTLHISLCPNIKLLPTLPRSLEVFDLDDSNRELTWSCERKEYPNWEKIEHIRKNTIDGRSIRNEQGYELKQLRDLNMLSGKLKICGLENVESKDEALEANLSAKEWLTELTLTWDYRSAVLEVEADVLEGLCPPVRLQTLEIHRYRGSRYPDWMVGQQKGGPMDLKTLKFSYWEQQGPGPELEAFPHLQMLRLCACYWDTLPGNMEHLTSLKTLLISHCPNIKLLPTLPQSLVFFSLHNSNRELTLSCTTKEHPNWEKIKHIREKIIEEVQREDSCHDSDTL